LIVGVEDARAVRERAGDGEAAGQLQRATAGVIEIDETRASAGLLICYERGRPAPTVLTGHHEVRGLAAWRMKLEAPAWKNTEIEKFREKIVA
jgi:hypothetical protein